MAKQQLRDHINLIKRKLTELKDMNDDIINEIIGDVKALTNFKIEAEPIKISNKKKQIKKINQIQTTRNIIKLMTNPR